jgi:WD40 repeat protein
MPEKRRKGGKGSKKKGGDVTASSSSVSATPASLRLDALKVRVAQLRARGTELTERIERDRREQAEVREALAEAETELVLAPVPNGTDPTAWLPEELLMAILIQVVTEGVCGLVCRRWYAVCQGARVKRQAWEGRWEGYSAGWRVPQKLIGHTHILSALAVGPDGTVYTGSYDGEMRAWSGTDSACLRILPGPSFVALSLAVGGPTGTVYGGADLGEESGEIGVWSGTDGRRMVNLEGHPGHRVHALVVAVDGTLYSGSADNTIRVWSNGDRVRTLIGHTDVVPTLAIGTHGKLYSGSYDKTIRVWSTADGTHLSTLEGHSSLVVSVAVGLDGTVYSGSWDKTVRVWAGDDGRPLRTLQGHTDAVLAVAVDSDGTIYSTSLDKTTRVWSGATFTARVLSGMDVNECTRTLALGWDDKLYSPGQSRELIAVW